MAKKKKAKKKFQRHHSSGSIAGASRPPATALDASTPSKAAQAAKQPSVAAGRLIAAANTDRLAYVGSDLRRIGVLATGCIVAELLLWYLFGHTGLGNAVYGLIK